MELKIIFSETGIALGVESGATFEEAYVLLKQIREKLAPLGELGILQFEGDIEQHRHDEHHAYLHTRTSPYTE
jgi:hypothetical protein